MNEPLLVPALDVLASLGESLSYSLGLPVQDGYSAVPRQWLTDWHMQAKLVLELLDPRGRSGKERPVIDRNALTPEQLARLEAWIDTVHDIAQLSDAALADLVEQEVSHCCELTWRQLTILEEVQDRLRGVERVPTKGEPHDHIG